jgi:hypothetical protein
MATAVSLHVAMVSFGNCWCCGVPVYGPYSKYKTCKESDTKNFYCINGHSAVFTESEVDRLKKDLEKAEQAKQQAIKKKEWAEQAEKTARHAEAVARGKLKAQSERVKHGVCPCCKRTVKQLAAHMKSKHPNWNGDE